MENLIETIDLKKYFFIRRMFFGKTITIKAVDGINLKIKEGETFGLVGESGCGKTTLGRTILRLIEPTSGKILFMNKDIVKMKEYELRKIRCYMQIVFQDPYSSLNPRFTIKDIIGEPLKIHEKLNNKELKERIANILNSVGLSSDIMNKYPHEFSGGQRQRIAIARALILKPKFLVLDEPSSSLDVSIQAQILNLLKKLQKEFKLTYLFISHDLSTVNFMSNRIAVMYLGKFVEYGLKNQVFNTPYHPYTKALLSAIPIPDLSFRNREKILLLGTPPSSAYPPIGCRFHTRCPEKISKTCEIEEPELIEIGKYHFVSCHKFR
ncbi:MAG: ATP-binding cassette domain-containing protein [Nitrososphaerota archaeon]